MKVLSLLTSVLVFGTTSYASASCDYATQSVKALKAALAVEQVDGGSPLTTELYSLGSAQDTFGILLSFSGVQHVFRVTVDATSCMIKSVQRSD